MLIGFLLQVIFAILSILFSPIRLPQLPAEFQHYIDTLIYWITSGIDILWLVFPRQVVAILLPLILAIETAYCGYCIAMWVIRKLPLLGIS